MATTSTASPPAELRQGRSRLSVDSFDRTATLILALLVTIGTVVAILAVIFFANKFGRRTTAPPIAVVAMEATSPTGNGGLGTDPDPPGVPDAPELSEPALQDTLLAVTSPDVLSSPVVSDAVLSEQTIRGTADQAGRGNGVGDARQPGPGNDGVIERVPRWERWKIRFEPQSAADFAAWLDQYDIRVGVLGRDNKVHLAWGFSKGTPQLETAEPKKYSGWGQTLPSDGPMPELTRQLARDAGIFQQGPIVLLFYPFEVESLLWNLEKERNKLGDANKIRETVFTVTHESDEFKFAVISQKYF
jgi:hypothetical protein